jgi:hypothetical protein
MTDVYRPTHSCDHLVTTELISLLVLYVVDTCCLQPPVRLLSSDTASYPSLSVQPYHYLCRHFSHNIISLGHWAAVAMLLCHVADISGSNVVQVQWIYHITALILLFENYSSRNYRSTNGPGCSGVFLSMAPVDLARWQALAHRS